MRMPLSVVWLVLAGVLLFVSWAFGAQGDPFADLFRAQQDYLVQAQVLAWVRYVLIPGIFVVWAVLRHLRRMREIGLALVGIRDTLHALRSTGGL